MGQNKKMDGEDRYFKQSIPGIANRARVSEANSKEYGSLTSRSLAFIGF